MAAENSQRAASSSTPRWTFDVFLSFRGETRLGFTDHLHFALQSKGFIVFRDDEKLDRGGNIQPELLKAIQESEYAIIVISENYAFSTWCLDELTEIVKCKGEKGLKLLPVFYKVDPSDVRKQKGSFGMAFAKHAADNVNEKRREVWRDALEEVCNVSGWDVRNRHESKIVEEICRKISNGLCRHMLKIDDDLIGIESRIEKLMTLLHIGGDDVRFIGICGMGGIGKTTLSEVIYNRVFSRFEADCFIANVREESQKARSLLPLQKELISQILGEKEPKIHNTFQGRSLIANKAKNRKVFIVLDDVDKEIQLEELVGNHNWFGKGSRILVTSRDGHLLKRHVDETYKVEELTSHHALQLFHLKAFKQCSYEGNYAQYSKEIIKYAGGLPLALKIFGSFLFGCKIDAWESALDRLKADPGSNILGILKISFEGLDKIQQNLFLDIACFFKGELVNSVIYKLKALGHFPTNDIPILESKSLIKISEKNTLQMHDLLQQMGHQVVNESQEEPGKRSRLWYYKDIIHVLNNNTGTDAIESIVLKLPFSKQVTLSFEALSKMTKLKMLVIMISSIYEDRRYDQLVIKWSGDPSKLILNSELRILECWGFPLNYFPSTWVLDNLVCLKIHKSFIKKPWDRNEILDKLKCVNLTNLRRLIRDQDRQSSVKCKQSNFSNFSNLVSTLTSGSSLEIDWSSYNLVSGELPNPNGISNLHSILGLRSLVELDMSSYNLVDGDLPDNLSCLSSLKYLFLCENKFTRLPNSISQLSSLSILDLKRCTQLQTLPLGISQLSNLEGLLLDCCLRLQSLPPKLPFYLANLSIEICPLSDKFYVSLDALTSGVKLLLGDSSIMDFYFGYEDKPYTSIHLTESSDGWFGQPSMKVSWGPTMKSEIPGWFNQRSTCTFGMNQFPMTLDVPAALLQAIPLQMDENCNAMLMYWGLAVCIVYEIRAPNDCERESKKQKADEHGSSTSTMFDENSSACAAFVCEVLDKADSSRLSIGFCVSEVVPFGRNGVWVCIRDPSFMSLFRNGIAVEGDKFFKPVRREIEVSIKAISLNVEVKECGARVVHIPTFGGSGIGPPHDLCEVISNISPHGLLLLDPEAIWVGGRRRGPRLRL